MMLGRAARVLIGAGGLALALASPVLAQESAPAPGDPLRTVPEIIEKPGAADTQRPDAVQPDIPVVPLRPGETLSDRLGQTDGVLRPPSGIDPEIKKPAPVPDPGTTIIIPPPGTKANPAPAVPK